MGGECQGGHHGYQMSHYCLHHHHCCHPRPRHHRRWLRCPHNRHLHPLPEGCVKGGTGLSLSEGDDAHLILRGEAFEEMVDLEVGGESSLASL
ncbi:hypothetical protein CLOP_g5861 [Closterium sp. NIES-67]|nr:hypothetical protein CLOP_g5861 [Closterium sp. NIES-67]